MCAANVTVAAQSAQFCDCMKNIHLGWFGCTGLSVLASFLRKLYAKFVDLDLFWSNVKKVVTELNWQKLKGKIKKTVKTLLKNQPKRVLWRVRGTRAGMCLRNVLLFWWGVEAGRCLGGRSRTSQLSGNGNHWCTVFWRLQSPCPASQLPSLSQENGNGLCLCFPASRN